MKPSISVVIPCYNAAAYIREALDSVLRQTYQPIEVLVIDDGSTDDSARIAQSYGPPVRVIRQSNQGQSVARNRGIDEARGDWIALLDADDFWEPEKLEKQCEAVARESGTVGCVLTHLYILVNGQRKEVKENPQYFLLDRPFVYMLTHPTLHPSSAIIRSDLARKVRFNPQHRQHEDTLFFIRLRAVTNFAFLGLPLLAYRMNLQGSDTSLTASHRYWIEGAWTRYCFARDHPELFDNVSLAEVRMRLLQVLASRHDSCYMIGDFMACNRALEIARLIASNELEIPARMFRRPWLAGFYRIRRRVGAFIKQSLLGGQR